MAKAVTYARAALNAVERRLFAGQRKRERERPVVVSPRSRMVAAARARVQMGVAALASAAFLAAFIFAVHYYSNTLPSISGHPLVTNLTAQGFKTRVTFDPPGCAKSARDCWAQRAYDSSKWLEAGIPDVAIRTLPGYEEGLERGRIYYRFEIPLTAEQRALDEELAFTPVFVTHKQYEIFVNGRLVQTGGTRSSASAAVVVSLPRRDLAGGNPVVTISASLDKADKGIEHPNGLYVGPKATIEQVYVFQERGLITYYLLFLLAKGAIFVVFSLFLFFSLDRRALFNFLLYAFCVTADNLLSGNFLASFLAIGPRVIAFYLLKAASIACLLSFFIEIFQAVRARRHARIWNAVMIATIGLLGADFAFGTKTVTPIHLYHLTNTILLATLALGIGVGLVAIRLWRRVKVESRKIVSLQTFVAVIFVYAALLVWEFYFNQFVGFDKRAVFDLMFFFFIAFATAKEFGFNAGQVLTLESHMREKRRMEVELQEAAEIAKAFIPGGLPAWDFFRLGVFHRSLSESSGDWYVFEESPSGRFCHLVMCDITGHGVQAAIVVSTCRTVLSAMKLEDPECMESSELIATYARALNHVLYTQGAGNHVSTLLGMTYDRESHRLYYVSGGHPNPMLITAAGRSVKPLMSRHGVLGMSPNVDHAMSSVELALGDEVLAFTDGLPLGAHHKAFRRFVASGDYEPADAVKSLYTEIWEQEAQRRGRQPDDDVSIVWLRRVA